jgi:plastocyanin
VRRLAPAAIAGLAALALALPAGNAVAATLPVTVQFQAFAPSSLDALPGDKVTWANGSGRHHTVTADGGEFDSDDLPDRGRFSYTFKSPGTYLYHCTFHFGMVGEVDVRRVTLDPLPPGLVAAGGGLAMSGRTADPAATVRLERDTGRGFVPVATVSPRADGTWNARVIATTTARFRASVGPDVSETRRLLVANPSVRVRATRGGIVVTVVPAVPYARISLQLHLRERFGWWPAAETLLDYLSEARFRIRGPVQARVALLDRDGWTPLALSPVIRIGRG